MAERNFLNDDGDPIPLRFQEAILEEYPVSGVGGGCSPGYPRVLSKSYLSYFSTHLFIRVIILFLMERVDS